MGLGFLPLGLAFGALVTQSGLDRWWAGLPAALILGGSFMVNVRHVFYALSFPLHRVTGRLGKAYSTYAMCDEAYALTTGEQARTWSSRRILWLQLFLHLYWAGSSTAAGVPGSLVPDSVSGLDFALTALFTVLALDAVRDLRGDLPTPALAVLSALAARLLFPGQMHLAAFALFTAALLARHLATSRKPSRARCPSPPSRRCAPDGLRPLKPDLSCLTPVARTSTAPLSSRRRNQASRKKSNESLRMRTAR